MNEAKAGYPMHTCTTNAVMANACDGLLTRESLPVSTYAAWTLAARRHAAWTAAWAQCLADQSGPVPYRTADVRDIQTIITNDATPGLYPDASSGSGFPNIFTNFSRSRSVFNAS